jgi:hypothetical protein
MLQALTIPLTPAADFSMALLSQLDRVPQNTKKNVNKPYKHETIPTTLFIIIVFFMVF